jgi:hypothetical protein
MNKYEVIAMFMSKEGLIYAPHHIPSVMSPPLKRAISHNQDLYGVSLLK